MIIKEHGNQNKIHEIIRTMEKEPNISMSCSECGCKFFVDEDECKRTGDGWVTKVVTDNYRTEVVTTIVVKVKCPECNSECFGCIKEARA